MPKPYGFKFWGALAVAAFGAALIALAAVANGPERPLTFERTAVSSAGPNTLGLAISAVINWPKWFHSLDSAQVLDVAGRPYPMRDQTIAPGATVRLNFNTHKSPWSAYDLLVRITAYTPARSIEMRVLDDSKHQLARAFDEITWRIDLEPAADGTRVVGHARAITRGWKSRLAGALFERIVMNQVFYPDVQALALLDHPSEPNPFPITGQ